QPVAVDGGCTIIRPGSQLLLAVPWSGGAIGQMQIGFGGGCKVRAPVAGGASSGVAMLPAQIDPSVCANLASICHQIKCYEQVVTPSGVVSKAVARQMVLNCSSNPCPQYDPTGVIVTVGGSACIPDPVAG